MTVPFPPESQDTAPGTRALTTPQRQMLDGLIEEHAHQLRGISHALGGMIEHYSECACEQEDPNHDALVLVIPEPYLSAYKKHWPKFRQTIEQEVSQSSLDKGVPA